MRRLTYWVASMLDDGPAYAIRAKTRKECNRLRHEHESGAASFDVPRKVIIEYENPFDLVCKVLAEGGAES